MSRINSVPTPVPFGVFMSAWCIAEKILFVGPVPLILKVIVPRLRDHAYKELMRLLLKNAEKSLGMMRDSVKKNLCRLFV